MAREHREFVEKMPFRHAHYLGEGLGVPSRFTKYFSVVSFGLLSTTVSCLNGGF